MTSRKGLKYESLSQEEEFRQQAAPAEIDRRFTYELEEEVPWKSIALAVFLLLFGTLFLLIAYLVIWGHMGGDPSQGYGFLTLGILLFLPGFYETRIAYYTWRGCSGYSFSKIPAY